MAYPTHLMVCPPTTSEGYTSRMARNTSANDVFSLSVKVFSRIICKFLLRKPTLFQKNVNLFLLFNHWSTIKLRFRVCFPNTIQGRLASRWLISLVDD